MRIKIHNWFIKNNWPEPAELINPGSVLEVPDARGRLWLLSGIGSKSMEEPTPRSKAIWDKIMAFFGWDSSP